MAPPLKEYIKIKDKYAVCYFGYCREYILLLNYLRPQIEKKFIGLEIHIGCRREYRNLLDGINIFTEEDISSKKDRSKYGYIRELKSNCETHPIQDLLEESKIPYPAKPPKSFIKSKICAICPEANLPNRPMTSSQINQAKFLAVSRGFEPQVDCHLEDAGWVITVENETLVKAGISGNRITLVENGYGTDFYNNLFNIENIKFQDQSYIK